MKKRMLITASHEEESRVAVIEDDFLQELNIESAQKAVTKGNIYKGTITKVEPSLQAAFVEYGSARQGFLPINEIHPDYWKEGVDKTEDPRKLSIQNLIEHKQQILIQVVKEERGNKGAALTTQISLAGRYLVLSPNTNRGGISRKLNDDDRRSMKAILTQLDVPETMGLIVRTAGKDQKLESLERDYSYLRRLWDEIRIKGDNAPSPSLIYLEGDLATRAIRDHFTEDIDEIWVDHHDTYTRTKQFVHAVIPGKEKIVKLYRGKKPLFRYYGIESQCEDIHEREIRLPSGGSIVFDPTEALTSVDINSSRSTRGKHIDDTALQTNMEAAREIARQLRIRDIGGLVVIDFIDMASRKHAQMVEEELRMATESDKARVQVTRISRFGLLEMSRQRLHPSVRETTTEECPRCQGKGSVRTVESMALQMLTRIEDLAESGKKPTLVVQIPSETGEYLMNNKRDSIARIEEMYEIQVSLQIRPELAIPHYRIERHWSEENQKCMEVLEDTGKNKKPIRAARKLKALKPVVGVPTAPEEQQKPKKGFLKAIIDALFSSSSNDDVQEEEQKQRPNNRRRDRNDGAGTRTRSRRKNNTDRDNVADNKDVVVDTEQPEASATPEDKPKRRRRRRRRPRNNEEDTGVQENQTASTDSSSDAESDHSDVSLITSDDTQVAKTEGDTTTDASTSEDKPKRPRRRRRPRKPANAEGGESKDEPVTDDDHASSGTDASEESKPKRPRRRRTSPKKDTADNAEKSGDADSKPADHTDSKPASVEQDN